MSKLIWITLASVGCSSDGSVGQTHLDDTAQVALVPANPSRELDVLFVIDDSPSMLAKQQGLVAAMPAFNDMLATLPDGLPNLHVGVASTDLGTSASLDPSPGPGIGAGPGSCAGTGKDGVLLTSTLEPGYMTSLPDAAATITALGSGGCGFEQPLRATARALENPVNAGFLRDTADLAIILLGDEDDCSIARTALLGTDTYNLGPLQSFRCTRFGVVCDEGGEDPHFMNKPGVKTRCHANESVGYLTSIAEMVSSIALRKADPRRILFGALTAAASDLEVEMRTPPGGGTAAPALTHQCAFAGPNGEEVIDPAIRITEAASLLPRSHVASICNGDVGGALMLMAREIRGMQGDGCLTRDIALPAECDAYDTYSDGTSVQLQPCGANASVDCFRIVADPGCPGQQRRVDVARTYTPNADTMVSVRCKL